MKTKVKNVKARSYMFLALTFLVYNAASQDAGDKIVKAIYKVEYQKLGLSIPDTVFKQLGTDKFEFAVETGSIYYENYYINGFSRTDISFKVNETINGNLDTKSYTVITNLADSIYTLFENGKLNSSFTYFLPPLTRTDTKKKINNHNSTLYTYISPDGLRMNVWIGDELPFYVSPGIYYTNLGGITKIEYFLKEEHWSINLISNSKVENDLDIGTFVYKPWSEARLVHPLLRVVE